jgi:hypothetical protein
MNRTWQPAVSEKHIAFRSRADAHFATRVLLLKDFISVFDLLAIEIAAWNE